MTDDRQSAEECPVCGERRLALGPDHRPELGKVRPYDELLGMGDPTQRPEPSIECLACGSSWPNLEAFRAAQAAADGA